MILVVVNQEPGMTSLIQCGNSSGILIYINDTGDDKETVPWNYA